MVSTVSQVIRVTHLDVVDLIRRTTASGKSQRINLHPDVDDPLHEMVICHLGNHIPRPHRHPDKAVSLTTLVGDAELYIYDDKGRPFESYSLDRGMQSIVRIPPGIWYAQKVLTNHWVFIETLRGPWKTEHTEWM